MVFKYKIFGIEIVLRNNQYENSNYWKLFYILLACLWKEEEKVADLNDDPGEQAGGVH